ncbi:hypothetical protein [Paenibacillus sp. MY03]|nr:hypothetical protein [Paenibacillus sp. MY03]
MNLRERALAACLPVGALSGMEVNTRNALGSTFASWCAIGYGGISWNAL